MSFKESIEHILEFEGGYVNDPDDLGGETNFGISKRAFPDLDIQNITRQAAIDIYHDAYWIKAQCDMMPSPVANLVFDGSVNQGHKRAAKALQQAVGATEDGIIGPKTMALLHARYRAAPETTLINLAAARAYQYMSLKESQEEKYGYGWMRRLFKCYTISIKLMR